MAFGPQMLYNIFMGAKHSEAKSRKALIIYFIYTLLSIVCPAMYLTRGFTDVVINSKNNCMPVYDGCGTERWVIMDRIYPPPS